MTVFIPHNRISFTKKKKITFNDNTDQQGQSAYILVKATLQPNKFSSQQQI